MSSDLISYFDLNRDANARITAAIGSEIGRPQAPAWLQYLALIAGIIVQPSFAVYQRDHAWTIPFGPGWFLFSVIVGVIIFPAVYRRTFDDTNPKLVSIAPIFTAGLGWQTLMTTALAVAAGSK